MTFKCLLLVVFCLVVKKLPIEASVNDDFQNYFQPIAPGTKWCGDGSIAKHENDFGYYTDTDKCCKEHDNCDMFILGNSTQYGLYNPEPYSRCHCDCDKRFYECLMRSSTRMSRTIKEVFFTVLCKMCFREKHTPFDTGSAEVEYEFVDEYGWRPMWDKVAGMIMSVGFMKDHRDVDRYSDLEHPIEMPWFCL